MSTDREEVATGLDPGVVANEMGDATRRLREQGWKIKPLTEAVIIDETTLSSEARSA